MSYDHACLLRGYSFLSVAWTEKCVLAEASGAGGITWRSIQTQWVRSPQKFPINTVYCAKAIGNLRLSLYGALRDHIKKPKLAHLKNATAVADANLYAGSTCTADRRGVVFSFWYSVMGYAVES
jgi:hypothetical protein